MAEFIFKRSKYGKVRLYHTCDEINKKLYKTKRKVMISSDTDYKYCTLCGTMTTKGIRFQLKVLGIIDE